MVAEWCVSVIQLRIVWFVNKIVKYDYYISVFMLLSCIVDSAADSADAVITPLNIDVESYKKLHEKNLLDELSSHRCADTSSVCQSYETLHGLGLRGSVS